MEMHQWLAVIIGALNLVGLGIIGPLMMRLGSYRDREVHEIKAGVNEIKIKLDNHIQWHIDNHLR